MEVRDADWIAPVEVEVSISNGEEVFLQVRWPGQNAKLGAWVAVGGKVKISHRPPKMRIEENMGRLAWEYLKRKLCGRRGR